jgi:hypothetical protein
VGSAGDTLAWVTGSVCLAIWLVALVQFFLTSADSFSSSGERLALFANILIFNFIGAMVWFIYRRHLRPSTTELRA